MRNCGRKSARHEKGPGWTGIPGPSRWAETLVELAGGGKVADVLELVQMRMKKMLKKVDYQPLASDPSNLRWRNTAQWSRSIMVHDGLLKADSPRGVWEITDAGRKEVMSDE